MFLPFHPDLTVFPLRHRSIAGDRHANATCVFSRYLNPGNPHSHSIIAVSL
jgi:hypothetical protein